MIRMAIICNDGFDGGCWWWDVNGDGNSIVCVYNLVALANFLNSISKNSST